VSVGAAPQQNEAAVKISTHYDQEALAPETQREPNACGQNDRVGDKIICQYLRSLVRRGRKRPGNVGQRYAGDGGIEYLHECGQDGRNSDQLGIHPSILRLLAVASDMG